MSAEKIMHYDPATGTLGTTPTEKELLEALRKQEELGGPKINDVLEVQLPEGGNRGYVNVSIRNYGKE